MRDFCADFFHAIFDILKSSRRKLHGKKMRKKIYLATVGSFERGLLLILLVQIGCSPEKPQNRPQVLHLNLATDPVSSDPRQVRMVQDLTFMKQLYEGLMRLNEDGIPQPAIAEKVEISDDQLTYTFQLRKSVWNNDTPLTAYDFEQSWKKVLDPNFACMYAYMFFPIKNAQAAFLGHCPPEEIGIQAIDNQTLVVHLRAPTTYFLELTAFPTYYPVKENGLSNGPFYLKEWNAQNHILLEKNPTYWDRNAVQLDQIAFSIIDETHTEICLFEKNEIDWLGPPLSKNVPPETLSHWKAEGLFSHPYSGTFWFQFNTDKVPFKNAKMRLAFSQAIQRNEIVSLFQGEQAIAFGILPPSMRLNHFVQTGQPEAAQLFEEGLAEMGWTRDSMPKIVLSYPGRDKISQIVQLVQQQWQKTFSIPIELERMEYQVYRAKTKAGDYQVGTGEWIADFNDPIAFLEIFSQQNDAGWTSEAFNVLLESSRVERDPNKRCGLLQKAEKILIDELPIAPVYHYAFDCVKKSYLQDVILSPLGLADFKYAKIIK